MTRIIVLFNLRAEASPDDYEAWARSTDIPTVNALGSVSCFSVLRATGLLGSEGDPPYQYVEIIDVDDMRRFGSEVATELMQKVAAEFQSFADQPVFHPDRSARVGVVGSVRRSQGQDGVHHWRRVVPGA